MWGLATPVAIVYTFCMELIAKGKALVSECEGAVRLLMEEALANRLYNDIPSLAALAAGLSELVSGRGVGSAHVGDGAAPPSHREPSEHSDVQSSAARPRKDTYPRFERHTDRLVKIGWSKKDRQEYEHRAPIAAVRAVFATLLTSANKRGYIHLDRVLPIEHEGTEIPSYQAYLVLAWLRDLGVVDKHGNDGYKLDRKKISERDIDDLLGETPERE